MDYQLALSSDLTLSPADFVAVWNISTEYRAVAEAHLLSSDLVMLKKREDIDTTIHTIEKLIREVFRREGISGITITHQNTQNDTQLLAVNNS